MEANERIDDLQRNGLRILQKKDGFRFGMDAVLLADFARMKPGDRVADMGTGTGVLPLLLSQKQADSTFDAFEVQPDMADMARRSVEMNGLEKRIRIYEADMRRAPELLGRESVHAVVCNPPYGGRESAMVSRTENMLISKYETDMGIEDILCVCGQVLRDRGRLSMVYPARRLLDLCDAMRRVRLEPKRLRMVCVRADKAPYLTLVEAMKNVRPGLSWLPPLIVLDERGRETPEIDRIYHRV